MRNSKVLDIIDNLKAAKINIQISDPIVSPEEVVESTGRIDQNRKFKTFKYISFSSCS